MALVPPSASSAGTIDPAQGARQLFALTAWIYRYCNEITAEADLNVVKIYDLYRNCRSFRIEADKWIDAGEVTEVLEALVALTRESGLGSPSKTAAEINQDYKDLYAAAGVFQTWAEANLTDYGATITGSTVVAHRVPWADRNGVALPPDGVGIFDPLITVNKPPAAQTQIDALRAVFV